MPTIKPKIEFTPNSPLKVDSNTRKEINKDYIIQVKHPNGETRLRGAGTLYKDFGHTTAFKLFSRVLSHSVDGYARKFNNGKQVAFFLR